ncbi:MAG: ABC transporter permease [Euryarchaeota archaeon]|nr:ABC transporter permease [Euryarchaeota archaeon]
MVYFSLAARNLLRRKFWTALTVLGIAIGIAAIFSLISFGESMQAEVTKQVKEVIIADLFISSTTGGDLPQTLATTIEKLPDVEGVSSEFSTFVRIKDTSFMLIGLEPKEIRKLRILKIIKGRDLESTDTFSIVLSENVASKDHLNTDVGNRIKITTSAGDKEFLVIGLCEDVTNFGYVGYIPLETSQKLFDKKDKITRVLVKIKNHEKVDEATNRLQRSLGNKVNIEASKEQLTSIAEITRQLNTFMVSIAAVSIIVGGFLISNTLMMSVTQRLREIAILKAIGGRGLTIIKIFLIEANIIGILGSFFGVLLGFGFTLAIEELMPRTFGFMQVSIALSYRALAVAIGLGLALSIFFGLYPSWKASKVRPLEVLRPSYETPHRNRIYRLFLRFLEVLAYPLKILLKLFPTAARNLSRRKFRTTLTVLGISAGIASVIAIWSLGLLVQSHVIYEIKSMIGADVIVSPKAQAGPQGGSGELPISIVEGVERMPNIEKTSPNIWQIVSISGFKVVLLGIEPESYQAVGAKVNIIKGRFLTSTDDRSIILSKTLAEKLLTVDVGDRIRIDTFTGTEEFSVIGISTEAMFGPPGGEIKGSVWIPLKTAQKILGKEEKATGIYVKVKDVNKIEETSQKLKLALGKKADIVNLGQILDQVKKGIQTFWYFFISIAALAILVAALGIQNSVSMSVWERTREIGILKAIGATEWLVMKIFIQENLLIGILGGITGIVLGYVGAWELGRGFSSEMGEIYTGPIITIQLIIGGFIFAIVLAVVFGFYPAWKASRLKPVEALRYG